MLYDDICAIATPPGTSALSIIRCSGSEAHDKLLKIVKIKNIKYRRVYLKMIEISDNLHDDIMIVFYKNPRSYTGEDMAEIFLHGNPLILSGFLNLLKKNGFKQAEPGEFTKRAFLNGKLSLLKAESIASLIDSQSKRALEVASSVYDGNLDKEINILKDYLIKLLSEIEVELNYPEDVTNDYNLYLGELDKIISFSEDLIKKASSGIILSEGIRTAIIGNTNTGKSSLLNALSEKDRAIVTEEHGTTRDTIEEKIIIDGYFFKIVDTAGIRETTNRIEKIGINRSLNELKKADLVLFLIDLSNPVNDIELYEKYKFFAAKHIVIGNKKDIKNSKLSICDLTISAKNGEGIDELKKLMISKIIDLTSSGDGVYFLNQRQKSCVERVLELLLNIRDSIKEGISPDILSTLVQQSLNIMEEMTGKIHSEEVIDKIFSNFCVGK
ncbi:MAG: tRNA modification GTPase [Kosmotogales bacterium]|nr:tRNA modification GTPase [Kosmotogales bacterium]